MDQTFGVKLTDIVDKMKFGVIRKAADYDRIRITSPNLNRPGLQLAGFYEFFDYDRIQLFGKIETAYLEDFPSAVRRQRFADYFATKIPALVICHDVDLLPECMEMADKYDITLLKADWDTSELQATLISFLQERLAPTITRHGVFVEVYGEGLLLTGESGIGKSEAAIELIKRGHRLIADDAVEIRRVGSNTLIGSAPELIRYYIELRGIGVVDLRSTFGSGAVKMSEQIDLVVCLENWQDGMDYDRIGLEEHYTELMGVEVPYVKIPIKPGRNLAVILEVAAMNNRQKKMGYNAAREFNRRINSYFERNTPDD